MSKHYRRKLQLSPLLEKANYFLFGPRSVGKSSLIHEQLPGSLLIDLLDDAVYEELQRRPQALRERIEAQPGRLVVIDEVQKLPKLLDEVHRLIEEKKTRFLLTGSSARKLRRGGANMLGGRAREAALFPLSYSEISDFELLRYLNYGGIPRIYLSEEPEEDLRAYGRIYLAEEIKMEAAVRNYDRFVRFLEIMALSNGQELNYQSLSSDSGVPARTLEGHIEVLKDTLIGYELPPFQLTRRRKAVTRSKFFFFDCGVANYFARRLPLPENSQDLGICFEQFLIQEVRSYLAYSRKERPLAYWRSREAEVDLIIGRELAIEIKYSKTFKSEYTRGLRALGEEKLVKRLMVVGRFPARGKAEGIEYLGYEEFLKELWGGALI
ncbi:MAG: AAA family ATPase [Oligoflexia bacterium]|nr:AAA family ATPase [Oligoflexia bacterium]